jgi:hypothetical protein
MIICQWGGSAKTAVGIYGADFCRLLDPRPERGDQIPKPLIEGVSERVDCFGKVVVPFNEEEAQTAIRKKKAPAPSTERLGGLLKRTSIAVSYFER